METKFNEIWQDAEGCLMTPADTRGEEWYVFANNHTVNVNDPRVAHPLTLVVDSTGRVATDRLNYPTKPDQA